MDSSVAFILHEFEQDKLYGTVEVKLEAGRVVLIKKIETIKPATYRDTRGEADDETPRALNHK